MAKELYLLFNAEGELRAFSNSQAELFKLAKYKAPLVTGDILPVGVIVAQPEQKVPMAQERSKPDSNLVYKQDSFGVLTELDIKRLAFEMENIK